MEIAVAAGTESLGNCILRVNHAGENGAVNIYRGQIAVSRWLWRDRVAELREFQAHEERHRSIFDAELARRAHRRCRSFHLCGLGGLALGVITGLCGRQAIAATTYAVEHVVLRHLEQQIEVLGSTDPAACATVQAIIDDERAHHDAAADSLSSNFWRRLLVPIVAVSTEFVIWTGMRRR